MNSFEVRRARRREQQHQAALRQARELSEALPRTFFPNASYYSEEPFLRNWRQLGTKGYEQTVPYDDYADLERIIGESRYLCQYSELAINVLEQRQCYLIGEGHSYEYDTGSERTKKRVNAYLQDWLEMVDWPGRQPEMLWNMDRDGEVFLRYYETPEGLDIRYVLPEQVNNEVPGDDVHLGIEYATGDAETVVAYYIDGERVPADQIHHRKTTGRLDPRGVPIFNPVKENLYRIDILLRNMTDTLSSQAAIAMIRKWKTADSGAAQAIIDDLADETRERLSGRNVSKTYLEGSTVIDIPENTQVDFPIASLNAQNFINGVQAAIRTVASNFQIPEWVISAYNSSNTLSRDSAFIQLSATVQHYKRLQARMIYHDKQVIGKAVDFGASRGLVPTNWRQQGELVVMPNTIEVPTPFDELVRSFDRLLDKGVMSRETAAEKLNLNYDQELNRGAKPMETERASQPANASPAQSNNEPEKPSQSL